MFYINLIKLKTFTRWVYFPTSKMFRCNGRQYSISFNWKSVTLQRIQFWYNVLFYKYDSLFLDKIWLYQVIPQIKLLEHRSQCYQIEIERFRAGSHLRNFRVGWHPNFWKLDFCKNFTFSETNCISPSLKKCKTSNSISITTRRNKWRNEIGLYWVNRKKQE